MGEDLDRLAVLQRRLVQFCGADDPHDRHHSWQGERLTERHFLSILSEPSTVGSFLHIASILCGQSHHDQSDSFNPSTLESLVDLLVSSQLEDAIIV